MGLGLRKDDLLGKIKRRSPFFSHTPGSGSRPKRTVMSFRIEVVSKAVLSMYRRFSLRSSRQVNALISGLHYGRSGAT
jgi:hypothetical protein